jgi:2-hydroxycyclohexanecarboxyl-CoA dehydrogenase
MNLEIQRQIVIVTGGASGIGRAAAAAFAAEGASVAIWDVTEAAHRAADDLHRAHGVPCAGFLADIRDEHAVQAALQQTTQTLGPVDHLVHAAAIGSGKFGFPFTRLSPADWRAVMDVNIMGMVHVAHAIAPGMIERRRGTMVFIASVAGQIGSQSDPPYSASKAANINFAQCIAKDLAPHSVRVNTVCPGMVQTPLNRSVWQAWHDQASAADRLTYEDWSAQKLRAMIPLGRWQTPEAIADMVVFLSSARAAHVTGQTINVDGGYVMHW